MFSPMADNLSVEELHRLMSVEEEFANLLLIDCRSFLEFNTSHITSAHNVHCPPIVKRRSGGSIPLENVIRCSKTRAKLMAGAYRIVVVYDENTQNLINIAQDSNLYLVLKSLKEDSNLQGLFFLEGGFESVYCSYGELCTSQMSPTSSSELLLPGLSLCNPQGILIDAPLRDHTKRCFPHHEQEGPVQILPWLYLGNVCHAAQSGNLQKLGVSAVLNVSCASPPAVIRANFQYKCIPVDDNCMSELLGWFPEAIQFIEGVRENDGKVLVHCHAGISRSATICIAYLMYHKNYNLEQAYDFLKSKRHLIAPNLNFMRQLLEFETQLVEDKKVMFNARTSVGVGVGVSPNGRSRDSLGQLSLKGLHSQTLQLRPPMSLPVLPRTPCTNAQSAVFVFDSPLMSRSCSSSPTLGLCHSPILMHSPLTIQHSPLVSPS